MDISFEPKVVTDSNDRTQIGATILNEFQEKFATQLLNIGNVEFGESFQGICYVPDMKLIRNINNPEKYDGRFDLIDGQGRRFKAVYWEMEGKFDYHNSLAYVEGVYYTVGNGKTSKRIYRLSKISQSTIDIPKHVFFKYIEGLDKFKLNVESELNKLVDPQYIQVYLKAKDAGIITNLETTPFDEFYYVEMGSKLKMYMSILMDAVNFHKIHEINFDLLRIGLALRLWKPQVILTSTSGREVDLDYNYQIEELLYTIPLTLEKRLALLSFIKRDGTTLESIFVEESIQKYLNLLKIIDKTLEKSGDILIN